MDIPVRGWTFTHWWVRPVVKVWFNFYHKSVSYSAWEHVDWSKPIIFAPSHQSAFTDALCLILPTRYTNDRFIYPLIRADAFGNNKAVDWMLTAFHMLPVYRPKDRVDIKKRNERIFTDCYDILSRNRNLLIHPEGNCFAVRKVRPFKKGLARIAFGAEQVNDFDLDIQVVPVGINYRRVMGARGGIHIRFGTPIPITDYKQDYREHAATAMTRLTNKVEQEVKKVTVDIQKDQDYQFIDQTLKLCTKLVPPFAGSTEYSRQEVAFEKQAIARLEALLDAPSSAESLKQSVPKLKEMLNQLGLSEKLPLTETHSNFRLAMEGMGYLLTSPLFLYGWINNIIPWVLIHKLASRIDDHQFVNSIRMVAGLLAFPTFYLLQSLILGLISGKLVWGVLYFISLPLSGILSLNIAERWQLWKQQFRLSRLSGQQKEMLSGAKKKLLEQLGLSSKAGDGKSADAAET